MTIMTSIGLQKADAVEIERRYSGKTIRKVAYSLYLLCIVISTILLYLFPTALMIASFIIIHLTLLFSLYFLVHLMVNSTESDLVYDGTRLAWRPSFSTEGSADHLEARRSSYVRNEHLSYTFI